MARLIILSTTIILSFFFNGCNEQDKLTMDLDKEIGQYMQIKAPIGERECVQAKVYEVRGRAECPRSMNIDECFKFQYEIAKEVRFGAERQVEEIKIVNEGNR